MRLMWVPPKSKPPQATDWRSTAALHCSLNICFRVTELPCWNSASEAGKLLINRQPLSCSRRDVFPLHLSDGENKHFHTGAKKPFPFHEITFHWAIGPGAENIIKKELQQGAEQWKLLSGRERQTDTSLSYADTVNKWAVFIRSHSQCSINSQEDSTTKTAAVLIICVPFRSPLILFLGTFIVLHRTFHYSSHSCFSQNGSGSRNFIATMTTGFTKGALNGLSLPVTKTIWTNLW